MLHQRDRRGIEIEIAFAADEGGVVGRGEDKRLCALVVGRGYLFAVQTVGLRLAVERQDIRGVLLGDHARLQASPKGAAQLSFAYMRDVERLFALHVGRQVRMKGAVILFAVLPNLPQDSQCGVLVRRNDHLRERRYFLAHRDLQPCHGAGFDLKPLGVIAYGGEDQLRLRLHIYAQRIGAVGVGRGAYLRAPEMDIDIRNSFARRLIDDLTHDDGLHGVEPRAESQEPKKYYVS